MIDLVHIPGKPLSNYIKYMWYQQGYKPSGSVERVLPGVSSQIIINLADSKFHHFSSNLDKKYDYDDLILTGVRTKPVFLDSNTRTSTIGIAMKENAIPALFKIPASEFRNKVVSLYDVSTENISGLKEKLLAASQPKEKFLIVESYLCRLLGSQNYPNPAMNFVADRIYKSHGRIQISELLEQTGYTRRWFITLFREAVGATPKQFAKICRFQKALELLRKKDSPNYAEIALDCGYYDQSHFIHDFKDIGGISPSHYHRNQGEAKNHLAMHPA